MQKSVRASLRRLLRTPPGVIKSGCGPGDWKVALTRRLESLRYVAPTFLSADSGDIPVPGSMLRLTHF